MQRLTLSWTRVTANQNILGPSLHDDGQTRRRAKNGHGPFRQSAKNSSSPLRWQLFRHVTYPLLTPIVAIVMTFSVLFTFTDFQLIYVITRGGPVNATHLMATLSFQRAIPGGQLAEGAAIAMAMVPFLIAAILISFFGLQKRKWQQGSKD